MPPTTFRRAGYALAALAHLYACGCGTTAASTRPRGLPIERAMLFHPQPNAPGYLETKGAAEDVWFSSADGAAINGWYLPHPDPRAVVLYAGGNAGNISSNQSVLAFYRDQMHASVLIFDYRGYGRSRGEPSEAGFYADARAARKWLAGRAGVDESAVVLVGRSIGGAVMVDLAAADGARGLVLESTFTTIRDVAAAHVKFLPVRIIMSAHFDSATKIKRYRGPLLQSHGDADEVVPFPLGRRLFAAANEPKTFVPLPGGGHNDPTTPAYAAALDAFLDRLPPTPPPGPPRVSSNALPAAPR